jgi:hypothetical protein
MQITWRSLLIFFKSKLYSFNDARALISRPVLPLLRDGKGESSILSPNFPIEVNCKASGRKDHSTMNVDPNWVSAIGQAAGAVFTAIAAYVAYRTALTAKNVAERAATAAEEQTSATQRQTSMAAIQELLKDYAAPDLYDSLRRFGRFVANNRLHVVQIAAQSETGGVGALLH